ncbi:nucleotide-diphospho-sugar transferase [Zychaea mexicana]|uniref:nucleotide-diphospho-sugar transferase n=1 Tax=Zychaea mexicana TaxID=64656 RepID=UPI0022FEF8F8|nr:nucleotide-diphospho-sugar transferase [Zychaea mexicana]KAI9499717.1 nucleotide-diphospho-sugar transferase [Zychaea mexicana]
MALPAFLTREMNNWRVAGRQRLLLVGTLALLTISLLFFLPVSNFVSLNGAEEQNGLDSTTAAPESPVLPAQPPVDAPLSDFKPDDPVRACFVILVRNRELNGIVGTIEQIEQRFNKKYQYPYIFLNDDDFTQDFIDTTSALTTAGTRYGKLDSQMWGYPPFIDQNLAADKRAEMAKLGIPYAESESYRHMCRFQSGFFFRHPLLDEFDYYWRLEPDVDYHCDLDYDVFKFMRNNNKKYGFNIAFREFGATVPSLWQTVKDFERDRPEVVKHWPIKEDSLYRFITDDDGGSYNLCHFWTNFEIASLSLWRSNDYLKFFNYLDQSGGFFYERWGDAPVHSIAASMMLRKDEFHFFNDIGYRHTAYTHCPVEPEYRSKCNCNPDDNFDYNPGLSCYSVFKKALEE